MSSSSENTGALLSSGPLTRRLSNCCAMLKWWTKSRLKPKVGGARKEMAQPPPHHFKIPAYVLRGTERDLHRTMSTKLSFSLANSKNKAKPVGTAPPLKRPAAFASLDDETTEDVAPTASSSSTRGSTNQRLIAQNVEMSKTAKKRMEAEKKVDETVYQYDEVWENIQESRLRQKEAKEVESKERKVGSLRAR